MTNDREESQVSEIYLDYGAAVPLKAAMRSRFAQCLEEFSANPSALHQSGVRAKRALEAAREKIARCLLAQSNEIYFCGSGTEAVDLALSGAITALSESELTGTVIEVITTPLEHPAVLETLQAKEAQGLILVRYLEVDEAGVIDLNSLRAALNENTRLVTLMHVNSEIGVINPLGKISRLLAEHNQSNPRVYLHSDAAQSPFWLKLDVRSLGVDLLSLDVQKCGGPRGVGVLYAKHGTPLRALTRGGGQERGLRSGTENVPAIVVGADAFVVAQGEVEETAARVSALRNQWWQEVKAAIPGLELNGPDILNDTDAALRVANNLNICFKERDAEYLVIALSERGVAASLGSACSTQAKEANKEISSHVLEVIKPECSRSSIRFTLGPNTTATELTETTKRLQALLS